MAESNTYLQNIVEVYPHLDITSVVLNNDGQNNDILIVNDAFIFRFPKYRDALARLAVEATILKAITPHVPLPVPVPEFFNLKNQSVGRAFLGYRLIPGAPLWRTTFQAIKGVSVLDSLALQLGHFLMALHNTPVADLPLVISDTYEQWCAIYQRIREKLFPFMRPDARQWAIAHFELYLANSANFQYTPVLKHGDFGTSNILCVGRPLTITGIIDFGGAGLGDPAYDFAGLLSSYGEPFVLRCCQAYPEVEVLLPRIRFYKGTFALLEALFGIENDDGVAFESGIEMYR